MYLVGLRLSRMRPLPAQGILDQGGRRTLSKLIYCLFTPTLTFTKLAPVLSGQHLLLWMPLVVNMFVR
jgi:predicted permease